MDMTPQEYQEYVKRLAPKSPIFKDTAFAFFIGGAICALGQLIQNGFLSLGLAKADAGTATSICLIFLSALLTGLNLYNSIARFAGAGTLVPIITFFSFSATLPVSGMRLSSPFPSPPLFTAILLLLYEVLPVLIPDKLLHLQI